MAKRKLQENKGSIKTILLIILGIVIGAVLMLFFFGAGLFFFVRNINTPQKFDAKTVTQKSQDFNDVDKPDFSQQVDKQLQQANNVKRSSDVNAILNAINQYIADHNSIMPPAISDSPQHIAKSGVDLCSLLVPNYMAALPRDALVKNGTPVMVQECSTSYDTGYTIRKIGIRISISAPLAEIGATISVTR